MVQYQEPILTNRIKDLLEQELISLDNPVLQKWLCRRNVLEIGNEKYYLDDTKGILFKLITGQIGGQEA